MKILYFAWVREQVGKDSENIELPGGINTVSALTDWLTGQDEGYKAALGNRKNLKVAVNQTIVGWDHSLEGSDEVAFFPPMTGG